MQLPVMVGENKIRKGTICFLIITIVIVILEISCVKTEDKDITVSTSVRSVLSPLYATYKFENNGKNINIGVQPLYFPTGLITEVMKRDLILKEVLAEKGYEVRYYSFLKGNDVNQFLKSGDLDGGVGGDMPAIMASAIMDTIVPVMIQQGFISIIADDHMLIKNLKGKRIAYAYGSNAHYALLDALASGELDESQVTLVPMEVMAMPEALEKRDIDAFSAWEPTPFIALKKYRGFKVIHRSLSSGYLYFLKDFFIEHKDAMHHVLAAEHRAIKWLQEDENNLLKAGELVQKSIRELTGARLDLTLAEIASIAREDILYTASIPIVPENYLRDNGSLSKEFRFLRKLNAVSISSQWEKVRNSFDRSQLLEVINSPQKYRFNEFRYSMNGDNDE